MMARRSNKAAPGARETVPARELRLRLYAGAHIAMGPGKADLLEAIMRCGSISAAGRELGISYKRCWDMVETMNQCFRQSLVITAAGGSHGGGAMVTEYGHTVLREFRAMERAAEIAITEPMRALRMRLRARRKSQAGAR